MASPLDHRIDKWLPTPAELKQIETLAGYGMSIKMIAPLLSCSTTTLERNYANKESLVYGAFTEGRSKAQGQITQTAYKMANSGKQPGMTQFWLKRNAGWRDDDPVADNEKFGDIPDDPSLD